jgi:hypothetical protein
VNVYTQGDIVVSEVVFRERLPGNLPGPAVDPTTVDFYYQPDNSAPSDTITYVDATTPAIGTIAKIGIGRYVTWIDTTDFLGVTLEVWPASGDYQVTGWKQFEVVPVGGSV